MSSVDVTTSASTSDDIQRSQITRRISREYVYPPPQSSERQATLRGAIFSLSATILGGGILTLPLCFQLCGLVFGCLLLLCIAGASAFSIYLLISCSRRIRHGASYEEVVGSTFGRRAGQCVTILMFALVYLCVIAYTILIRDLVTPLAELVLDTHYGVFGRFMVVVIVLILVLPFCLKKTLNSLGFISIISIAAMLALAYTVVYRGMEQLILSYHDSYHRQSHDGLKLIPASFGDVAYAVPIFACAFTCHFNVLPLHRELIRPTRPRIKRMINWSGPPQ